MRHRRQTPASKPTSDSQHLCRHTPVTTPSAHARACRTQAKRMHHAMESKAACPHLVSTRLRPGTFWHAATPPIDTSESASFSSRNSSKTRPCQQNSSRDTCPRHDHTGQKHVPPDIHLPLRQESPALAPASSGRPSDTCALQGRRSWHVRHESPVAQRHIGLATLEPARRQMLMPTSELDTKRTNKVRFTAHSAMTPWTTPLNETMPNGGANCRTRRAAAELSSDSTSPPHPPPRGGLQATLLSSAQRYHRSSGRTATHKKAFQRRNAELGHDSTRVTRRNPQRRLRKHTSCNEHTINQTNKANENTIASFNAETTRCARNTHPQPSDCTLQTKNAQTQTKKQTQAHMHILSHHQIQSRSMHAHISGGDAGPRQTESVVTNSLVVGKQRATDRPNNHGLNTA